jgi:hypothetical protein
MQEPELTLSTMLFILFTMGAVLIVMVARSTNYFRSWRKVPIDLEKVREEFSGLMSDRLGIAMRAAELDKIIVDKWELWPLEYRPALYQVLRHTQLLEETMMEEAMEKGIYPRRIVTQGGAFIPPPPPMPSLPPDPWPELQTEPPSSNVVQLSPSSSHEWVRGQLVRTG